MPLTNKTKPLALYIHWPFCKAKCPYCDFNSHVREAVDHSAWRDALLAELEHMAGMLAPGHQLTSIFFGGGTPSLMEPGTVAALIEKAKASLPRRRESLSPPTSEVNGERDPCLRRDDIIEDDLEITLEANPTSVEASKFRDFRAAGVNRVSLGVQSLREESLRFLGREHSAREALDAVALAADTFERYSFDMIYALPNQTVRDWEDELREALPYMRGHASLYQLTIEPNTAFHHAYHIKKHFEIPQDEHAAALYGVTNALMEEAGLEAYEVSNYAAPGQECRHNLSYWRSESYLGIGPGAHGRLDHHDGQRYATATLKSPERWLERVQKQGYGLEENTALTPRECAEERLLMGLRLKEGLTLNSDVQTILDHDALSRLTEQGYLIFNNNRLTATSQGRLVLNHLIGMLVG